MDVCQMSAPEIVMVLLASAHTARGWRRLSCDHVEDTGNKWLRPIALANDVDCASPPTHTHQDIYLLILNLDMTQMKNKLDLTSTE